MRSLSDLFPATHFEIVPHHNDLLYSRWGSHGRVPLDRWRVVSSLVIDR
jgi:hypothetical protein